MNRCWTAGTGSRACTPACLSACLPGVCTSTPGDRRRLLYRHRLMLLWAVVLRAGPQAVRWHGQLPHDCMALAAHSLSRVQVLHLSYHTSAAANHTRARARASAPLLPPTVLVNPKPPPHIPRASARPYLIAKAATACVCVPLAPSVLVGALRFPLGAPRALPTRARALHGL